ncbi:MAG: HlyD family type I secretion periplasmic adaptor subunit [Rhodospirillales bacterium]|nr:HlyD family type I secretion periplasmic adaptor subunit [Alphaproteobacteria bacterium]MCB9986734.1 HlyD family type I secretion periplasmic adaptor subunit [Rhodospirillales bacterium]USO08497.1 MAG: HlyD family type I secretion periplasmic adaptor subunit [Rhodospirillales bacterium]
MLGANDPRKQQPQQSGSGPESQPAPGMDLSNAKDWEKIHKDTFGAKGPTDRFSAYADKFLVADDELPLHRHLQLLVICATIFVFLVWASFAKIEQTARGEGKVIPSSEIQEIQHQEGGTVDAIMVKEGQKVQMGEVLLRLRDVGAASDLGSSQAKYMGLQAKIARLQAEAEGLDAPKFSDDVMKAAPQSVQEELNTFRADKLSLNSEVDVLRSQLNQRAQEVNEITTKISDTNRVIALAQDEIDMIRPLVDRGSAPKRDLLQMDQGMAGHRTDLNGLRAALPRARAAVAEAQARLNDAATQFKSKAQAELAQTQIEVQSIGQTLGALEDKKSRTEIRSPVDGIVKDLKINTVGGVVKPAETVLEIVPTNDTLLVEARIRPADIAFIYPGEKAMVKLTAYDFSIYGGMPGEVADISADTITDEKGQSFYRVKVRTKVTTIKHDGEELPIIPGMVATVDILTGERTVMEYLMKPFIKTVDSALHEH